MSGENSATRLYLGNVPVHATKADLEEHFSKHGGGKINEVKLMNGFAFIEYEDQMDARDVVPAFHGSEFMGNRLIVQFARGNKPRDGGFPERPVPRTRRTQYRMTLTGLPPDTSWQDLKDFARKDYNGQDSLDVVFSEVSRDGKGFVEYETEKDLRSAVEIKDNHELKPTFFVHCVADILPERPRDSRERGPRSRSPRGGGGPGYGPPRGGGYYDYDRRRPPMHNDRDYRERSPRRGYYDDRERYGRSPPRGGRGPYGGDYPPGPPPGRDSYDEYPPPRRPYGDDGYGAPPPRRGYGGRPPQYDQDPYVNARGGGGPPGYDHPPSPRRRTPPMPRAAQGDPGYDRPRY